MRRIVKFVALALVAVAVIAILGVASFFGYRVYAQHKNAERFAIRTPNGIDEASYVMIGGIPQWITIRGKDRNNPVLLCVHGGPGGTWTPLTELFLDWENTFTVVQWDQRGAGKTFEENGPSEAPTMTIDRMTRDGIEVAEYLRTHLRKGKIVLLGHSWGSILSVNMIARRPDLFSAYVGTGQVTSFVSGTRYVYNQTLSKARAAGDTNTIQALLQAGSPPWPSDKLLSSFATLTRASATYAPPSEHSMQSILIQAYMNPEFTLHDLSERATAFDATPVQLYEQISTVDLPKVLTKFAVPVYFFQGTDDNVTPAPMVQAYFRHIAAPYKEYVPFQGGGHFTVWTMHEQFGRELTARVRPHLAEF